MYQVCLDTISHTVKHIQCRPKELFAVRDPFDDLPCLVEDDPILDKSEEPNLAFKVFSSEARPWLIQKVLRECPLDYTDMSSMLGLRGKPYNSQTRHSSSPGYADARCSSGMRTSPWPYTVGTFGVPSIAL